MHDRMGVYYTQPYNTWQRLCYRLDEILLTQVAATPSQNKTTSCAQSKSFIHVCDVTNLTKGPGASFQYDRVLFCKPDFRTSIGTRSYFSWSPVHYISILKSSGFRTVGAGPSPPTHTHTHILSITIITR